MPVKHRKDLTAEENLNVEKWKRQQQPRPLQKFDQYGLRFSLQWLRFVKCTVILLPLEDMALYADKVTTDALLAANETYLRRNIQAIEGVPDADFSAINATSLGNLAAVVLFDPSEDRQKTAHNFLNKVYDWHIAAIQATCS